MAVPIVTFCICMTSWCSYLPLFPNSVTFSLSGARFFLNGTINSSFWDFVLLLCMCICSTCMCLGLDGKYGIFKRPICWCLVISGTQGEGLGWLGGAWGMGLMRYLMHTWMRMHGICKFFPFASVERVIFGWPCFWWSIYCCHLMKSILVLLVLIKCVFTITHPFSVHFITCPIFADHSDKVP